jgi:hypothetical protein
VDLFNKILVIFVMTLALSSFGFTQAEDPAAEASPDTTVSCGPPAYGCARHDLVKTNNLNPPPSVSHGKNTIVTPSDFKLPIVRVTDRNTFGNVTLTTTLSGSNGDNIFNTDDTYLLVVGNGWKYPVSFNPATMQVLNASPWKVGTNQVRWSGSGSFSRTRRNTVFAVTGRSNSVPAVNGNGTTLYKLTLSGTASITATGAKVFDFAKCPGMPNPYDVGHGIWRSALTVSSGDKRFAQAFSNRLGGQDTGTDIAVYDAPTGQCYRYDAAHARLCTSTGCAPMSVFDEFTIHEVYMSLDGNYLRIVFGKCIKGGCTQGTSSNPYFWEIGTTNVTRCYTSAHTANCSGHMVEGYKHIYNAIGWPVTSRRSFTDPLSYAVINSSPTLTPSTDSHYSNNAADPNDTHPFWVTNVQNVRTTFGGAGCNKTGNLYQGCTFPGPLYGEVFGITQGGDYIRVAHTYNSGSSYYFNCANTIGAVSQTGKFFAWTSDWLTTLGKDSNNRYRCDVFVVKLAAEQGATH